MSKFERRQLRKAQNIRYVQESGFDFHIYNQETGHMLIEDVHFWPTTGKFYYNGATPVHGNGIDNLLRFVKLKSEDRANYQNFERQLKIA